MYQHQQTKEIENKYKQRKLSIFNNQFVLLNIFDLADGGDGEGGRVCPHQHKIDRNFRILKLIFPYRSTFPQIYLAS